MSRLHGPSHTARAAVALGFLLAISGVALLGATGLLPRPDGEARPAPAALVVLRVGLPGGALASDRPSLGDVSAPKSTHPEGIAPARLSETGLYSDPATRQVDPSNRPYSPQYPLWSDGADKRRWIHLPAGTTIDALSADSWSFPIGTKIWKEFALGRPLETRYMERLPDGSWLFAAYAWTEDGSDALLAPKGGRAPASPGGSPWQIPGYYDCLACHEGRPGRVLGFTALQLSPDRDALAPHQAGVDPGSLDLNALIDEGLLRNAPPEWREHPPRVGAGTPRGRAALGYLYGNCAHCHNAAGPLATLGLSLDVPTRSDGAELPAALTVIDRPTIARGSQTLRIASGAPERSWLLDRMKSRSPIEQMPPVGTNRSDSTAVRLIGDWIAHDLAAAP